MDIPQALTKGLRSFAWYVKGIMGEDAYEKYKTHHTTTDTGHPLMTEREFWRDKTDRQENNPQGRCC